METLLSEANGNRPAQYTASEVGEDHLLLSKSITTLPYETKSPDQGKDSKSEGTAPLTKVGSEKSIFSSIWERLDPLTSMLQERIEGTKEIFDRKLRKSDSVAETSEILIDPRTTDVVTPRDITTLAAADNDCNEGLVIFGRSSSVDIKDGADEMAANQFHKSTSAVLFPNRKCQFFSESDTALLSSTDDDPMSDDASYESPNFDDNEQCSVTHDNLRISTHPISTRHFSFDSCDYPVKDLVATSKPLLRSLTYLLWTKTQSFMLLHKMKLLVGVIFLALWLLLPFPSFISGLILGALLASGVAWVLHWLCISTGPHVCKPPATGKNMSFHLTLKPTIQPKKQPGLEMFEGWMNEMSSYEPSNFHISKTRSVHVTIANSVLRLKTPKYNIHRRAMWQERFPYPDFILQREFSLIDSKILLVPCGLVRKRLWCKKYPICVIAYPIETSEFSDEIDHGVDVLKAFDSVCNVTSSRLDDDCIKDSSVDPDIESVFTDEETFHGCKPKMVELFLFARANREKEEWYRHLVAATRIKPQSDDRKRLPTMSDVKSLDTKLLDSKSHSSKLLEEVEKRQRTASSDSNSDVQDIVIIGTSSKSLDKMPSNYLHYMLRFIPQEAMLSETNTECRTPSSESPVCGKATLKSDLETTVLPSPFTCKPEMLWLNALLSRFFFDFFHDRCWGEKMKGKLQAMLNKTHLPQFMDQLTITEIDLGDKLPSVSHASAPYLDDRGLWINLDISYDGGFSITMETKCNLIKATQNKSEAMSESPVHEKRSPVTHSDEEDSAESSTDDEIQDDYNDPVDDRRNTSSATSKRLLRLVDKIMQSRYFQHAADYKYIKKAIHEVSNTPLVLIVELNHLNGMLALNIPQPPTDRLWYGFQGNPTLQLSVKPRVGDRVVNVTHITEWIEKKLELEFQRIYVIPNMDDLVIPLMCDHITSDT